MKNEKIDLDRQRRLAMHQWITGVLAFVKKLCDSAYLPDKPIKDRRDEFIKENKDVPQEAKVLMALSVVIYNQRIVNDDTHYGAMLVGIRSLLDNHPVEVLAALNDLGKRIAGAKIDNQRTRGANNT